MSFSSSHHVEIGVLSREEQIPLPSVCRGKLASGRFSPFFLFAGEFVNAAVFFLSFEKVFSPTAVGDRVFSPFFSSF